MQNSIRIALAGNPNCGKTTLFNELTGSRQYVGNWAGVTVEKKEGKTSFEGKDIVVTDLPGTYSLSPYSIEEIVARNYIVYEKPDVVVNIVDSTNIDRNLYLTLQLIELGRPVVVALNMADLAQKRGIIIDAKKVSNILGVPVVPIIAAKNVGIDILMSEIIKFYNKKENYKPIKINYEKEIEEKSAIIEKLIEKKEEFKDINKRWLSLKILEQDKDILDKFNVQLNEEVTTSDEEELEDIESLIVDGKYSLISNVVSAGVKKPNTNVVTTSDKIDKVLTNKWIGMPIFAFLMYFVFWCTFNIGGIFLDLIDGFFGATLSGWVLSGLQAIGIQEWLQSLIVDGIIGGVGGILVFLPNIIILFIAISILEDSGYMARVAFIMDRAMKKIGLNGKAFIPMIMGFGCNVPAIMSTRTLENEKDRLTAILINPFMSCGARLPVYTLFAAAFFPKRAGLVVFSLYVLGIVVAITMGLIFKKTLFKGENTPFVMELPPYRIPTAKGIFIHVWDRVKGFLIKAGTVIFAASVVLWFVLGFNFSGPAELADSFGAYFGRIIAPIFTPLGFGNWQSSLALFTGIIAKEVVVSNMSIIYGIGQVATENSASLGSALSSTFTQLSAYAFMVFVLLYTPCIAVIATIKRETNSTKWAAFSVVYQFIVAWILAFVVYQIGGLFF
ncbi:ferrous iron transport protein B [Clostridium sp. DL1XJH146]